MRHPQGDRARALPARSGSVPGRRARSRCEPPGPDAGAAADPRPVRQRPRGARRHGRAGRHRRRSPTRRSTPASYLEPGTSGASRSTHGRRTRSRWPSGSVCPIFAADEVLDAGRRRCRTRTRRGREGGARRRRDLEATGETVVDPRLDVFREFVNSLDVEPATGGGGGGRLGLPRQPTIGSPRRRARSRDRPEPQAQQPEVLHRAPDDRRLGARRRAGRARVVGDADLDDPRGPTPELDQQLGREEGAARLDPDALERLAPEELAGAVDVADPQAEEDPVGEPVGPRVDDPDGRVGAPDAVADDDVRRGPRPPGARSAGRGPRPGTGGRRR